MITRIKEYRARYSSPRRKSRKSWQCARDESSFGTGKVQPVAQARAYVAKALHTTIDELFTFEGRRAPGPESRVVLVD